MQKFYLAWDDSRHTLGIVSIDIQHRELINRVNELADAVAAGCDTEQARLHMESLIHFTKSHFAHEESLMREHGFPGREEHISEHEEVLRQALTLMEALSPGNINRAVLATAFLTDCAENHILNEDKELALYLLSKGLS